MISYSDTIKQLELENESFSKSIQQLNQELAKDLSDQDIITSIENDRTRLRKLISNNKKRILYIQEQRSNQSYNNFEWSSI